MTQSSWSAKRRKDSQCPSAPELRALYPPNWPAISKRVRFQRAGGRCEKCGAQHGKPHPETGSLVVLSTAHLDHDPANNSESNLAALCQACHNRYDATKRAANRKTNALIDAMQAGQLALDGLQTPGYSHENA